MRQDDILSDFENGEMDPASSGIPAWRGLVSKHKNRPYRVGRSPHWIKVKNGKHPAKNRALGSSRRIVDPLEHAPLRYGLAVLSRG
jgi:hypothetical protein